MTFVILYCKNLVDRCFQGNLTVYFLIYSYAALYRMRFWRPWALDGDSGALNLSYGPISCAECGILFPSQYYMSRVWEETQSDARMVNLIRVHGGSGHLPEAYLAKVCRTMGIVSKLGEGFSVPRRGFSGSLRFHKESRF